MNCEKKKHDDADISDSDSSGSDSSEDSVFGSDPLKKRFGIRIKDVISLCGWIACTGIFIWYFYSSISKTVEAFKNPAVSLSFRQTTPMYFPAITLCNWNVDDKDGTIESSKFDIEECYRTNVTGNNVDFLPCEFPYEKKQIFTGVYYMNCVVFNNDSSAPAVAYRTGYSGSLVFRALFPFGVDDYPGFRAGATVSFHEIGTIPDLSSETNTATIGLDNTFTIRKMVTSRLVPIPTTEVVWDASYSAVEIIENRTDLVTITVAYNTLNIRDQKDIFTVDVLQLLGQLAGMTGTLYGLEIVKFLRGMLWIPQSIKKRTFKYIWDEFN